MADRGDFDSLHYLQNRFGNLSEQRAAYVLGQLHNVVGKYVKNQWVVGELKVLDFGSGPVIQNCISASAFASEIVFCDIFSSNREAVQKWLDGAPDAFDWSPHFDYVVKALEGRGEEEAREREERMRKVSKVVFCDALAEKPIEEGYEGPYDIIFQCACLEAACKDKESYKSSMKRLVSLLKPRGLLFCYATDYAVDWKDLEYTVGDGAHPYIGLSHSFVESVVREYGFGNIEVNVTPLSQHSPFSDLTLSQAPQGLHVVSGIKGIAPSGQL